MKPISPFVFGVLVASAPMRQALAAEFNWAGDIAAGVSHQRNVSLSANNPIDVNASQLGVNLQLWRDAQIAKSQVVLSLKNDRFSNNIEYEQDSRSLSLEHVVKQELTQYTLQGSLDRSTTLGDSYETGEYVRRNVPVLSRALSGGVNQQFDETISGAVETSLTEVRYEKSLDINTQDYDYNRFSISGRYHDSLTSNWQLSTYTDLIDKVRSDMQVSTFGLYLLRSYDWNEIWILSGKYGRRKSVTEVGGLVGRSFKQENLGRIASVDLTRKFQTGSLKFSANQDISPRATGVIDESIRLNGSVRINYSQRSTVSINASRVFRRPLNATFIEDSTVSDSITTTAEYYWSQSLSLDASARWSTRVVSTGNNTESADGSTITFGMHWHFNP